MLELSNGAYGGWAEVPDALAGKIEEIADQCPVHKTLEGNAKVKKIVR